MSTGERRITPGCKLSTKLDQSEWRSPVVFVLATIALLCPSPYNCLRDKSLLELDLASPGLHENKHGHTRQ